MTRGRIVAIAAVIAALAVVVSQVALAKSNIKDAMGENFAGMQVILTALITSNYATVPAQVESIRAHAVELREMVPAGAKAQQDQFLAYAYSLQTSAESLKSIAEVLSRRDQDAEALGEPQQDHLREALAAHYGGMVTTCVACHNIFRQRAVR